MHETLPQPTELLLDEFGPKIHLVKNYGAAEKLGEAMRA